MKKIVEVVEVISSSRIRVKDPVGRESILVTDKQFVVGDNILIVNGVIVRKTKKVAHAIYEV